jgi:hypothetical protein
VSSASEEATFEELVRSGRRFQFGRNWSRFLKHLDDERIREAERSLMEMLGTGSGSGLFSLAARRLGARVHSFDFDPDSVACTSALRNRFFPDDPSWTVERGSILDAAYVRSLGPADVSYAWGVLHHTGAMWSAMENAASSVAPGGFLYIMIYLDRGLNSRVWHRIKETYCSGPLGRAAVLGIFIPYFVVRGLVEDLIRLRKPWARYRDYKKERGMSLFFDWIDWLGGYPFEFATPEQVVSFCRQRGFVLVRQKEVEYVFRRADAEARPGPTASAPRAN